MVAMPCLASPLLNKTIEGLHGAKRSLICEEPITQWASQTERIGGQILVLSCHVRRHSLL